MNMKKILLIIVFFLLIPLCSFAKVYLVSVGISDYPGTDMDLSLPAKDAQTITWVYSKNSDLHYCQLLNEKATLANIVKAMESVYAKAKENDKIVVEDTKGFKTKDYIIKRKLMLYVHGIRIKEI